MSTSVLFSSNFTGYVSPAPLLQAGSRTPLCLGSGLSSGWYTLALNVLDSESESNTHWFESIQHITFIVKSELLSLK